MDLFSTGSHFRSLEKLVLFCHSLPITMETSDMEASFLEAVKECPRPPNLHSVILRAVGSHEICLLSESEM